MDDNPLSEYELLRQRNIALFKEEFKKKFGEEIKMTPLEPTVSSTTAAHRKRRAPKKLSYSRPTRRSRRINHRRKSRYMDDTDDSDYETNGFRGFKDASYKKNSRYSDPEFLSLSDSDEEYLTKTYEKKKTRNYTPRISLKVNRSVLQPEEITDSDLENISYSSAGKRYDINGTTCHQCRQKTKDTKSICRGNECSGVRGQFCGFCLRKRYGEDVAVVLKDPSWICPPCRNICNCSICRRRDGKLPTGILVPHALENGYDSVKDFLQSIDENALTNSE